MGDKEWGLVLEWLPYCNTVARGSARGVNPQWGAFLRDLVEDTGLDAAMELVRKKRTITRGLAACTVHRRALDILKKYARRDSLRRCYFVENPEAFAATLSLAPRPRAMP